MGWSERELEWEREKDRQTNRQAVGQTYRS